jgi:hypothetical protein
LLPLGARGGTERRRTAGIASPRVPAPPGFLNLLTLCSPPCLARLFHRAGALGICPFRGLLLAPGGLASRPARPCMPFTTRAAAAEAAHQSPSRAARLPGFRPGIEPGPGPPPAREGGRAPAAPLLGFCLLRLASPDVGAGFPTPPLADLRSLHSAPRRARPRAGGSGPPESRSVRVWESPLRGTPSPPGFGYLFFPPRSPAEGRRYRTSLNSS